MRLSDGSLLLEVRFGVHPRLMETSIFVGSDDCMLYALDLDGNMIWKTELNGKIKSSSPCLIEC